VKKWLKESLESWKRSDAINISSATSVGVEKKLYPKALTSAERRERLKLSYLGSLLKHVNKMDYIDKMRESKEFSQDEKDYVLFNINRLDEISRMYVADFKKEVLEHREAMDRLED
jgi:hypothetical protein